MRWLGWFAIYTYLCFCLQALNFLIQLGQEQSDLIYTVISSLDTVRALVGLAVSCQSGPARLLALRALSSVCCTGTTVAQLEECGGVDIVCGLLESGRLTIPGYNLKRYCYKT